MNSIPAVIDLVLLGGGHSHALFLKMWAMNPIKGVRVSLISDVTHTPYSGMLPAHIGGVYDYDQSHIDLRSLANFAGCEYIKAEAQALDATNKTIKLKDRADFSFDLLSLNIGSFPNLSHIKTLEKSLIPVKPVSNFLKQWDRVKESKDISSLCLIGAGAGGVELSLWMEKVLGSRIDIHIVQKNKNIMPTHHPKVRAILKSVLDKQGIHVHLEEEGIEFNGTELICKSGKKIQTDEVFGVTNASAPPWLLDSGLDVNEKGFIKIKKTLQSVSHSHIFAVGDIAHMAQHPREKTGVFAVRMAKPLYENIKRLILEEDLKDYIPQKNYLNLIGTADGKAVASRRFLASHGNYWWKLKDSIDLKFMAKFQNLEGMMDDSPSAPILKEAKFLDEKQKLKCLGCGAKVGGSILSRALGRIKSEEPDKKNEGVITDWRTLEDAAVLSIPNKKIVTSLDYFPALFNDPFLLGRLAALHSFSDTFAMGADPHSCLLQAQVPMMKDSLMEETLYQLVKGVFFEINKMPASLLGGHTTEGPLAIGLQVNGVLDKPIFKKTQSAGDKIILTKSLGTGVLFAAQMQGKTKGRWIDDAIETMLSSNQKAAQILSSVGCSAMTDVTGFGFLGHLNEMLAGASIGASISLDSLPCLDGALPMIEQKIKSSLYEQNENLSLGRIQGKVSTPLAKLGHDPQTSGGLLAFVSPEKESEALKKLKSSGYKNACTVGEIVEGTDSITLL